MCIRDSSQLYNYVAKLFNTTTSSISISLKGSNGEAITQIDTKDKALSEYGIKDNSAFVVSDACYNIPLNVYEEDKENPLLTEEEMLRQAIAESLRFVPQNSVFEEVKHVPQSRPHVHPRRPLPLIQINPDEADATEEPEMPKTPSTGNYFSV